METVGPETVAAPDAAPGAAVAAGVVPEPDDPVPPEVSDEPEVVRDRSVPRHRPTPPVVLPDRLVGGLEPEQQQDDDDRPDEGGGGAARDHDHRSALTLVREPFGMDLPARHAEGRAARASVARIIDAGPQT